MECSVHGTRKTSLIVYVKINFKSSKTEVLNLATMNRIQGVPINVTILLESVEKMGTFFLGHPVLIIFVDDLYVYFITQKIYS